MRNQSDVTTSHHDPEPFASFGGVESEEFDTVAGLVGLERSIRPDPRHETKTIATAVGQEFVDGISHPTPSLDGGVVEFGVGLARIMAPHCESRSRRLLAGGSNGLLHRIGGYSTQPRRNADIGECLVYEVELGIGTGQNCEVTPSGEDRFRVGDELGDSSGFGLFVVERVGRRSNARRT